MSYSDYESSDGVTQCIAFPERCENDDHSSIICDNDNFSGVYECTCGDSRDPNISFESPDVCDLPEAEAVAEMMEGCDWDITIVPE